MASLTITVDDEVLERARMRAAEQGTSVDAILAEHLARFAGLAYAQRDAIARLTSLGDSEEDRERAKARGKRRWTREELHERR